MFEERIYRKRMHPEALCSFRVVEAETDLFIAADMNYHEVVRAEVQRARQELIRQNQKEPDFFKSLVPLAVRQEDKTLVRRMKVVAKKVGVGPMAAVAGAVSAEVGKCLKRENCQSYIIENGGDILMLSEKERLLAVEAGASSFSGLHLKIPGSQEPLAICTSSGCVGHSLSFGCADAATVISSDSYLADAAATALGNRIKTAMDIDAAINWIKEVPGISGVLVLVKDHMGAWGQIELV